MSHKENNTGNKKGKKALKPDAKPPRFAVTLTETFIPAGRSLPEAFRTAKKPRA